MIPELEELMDTRIVTQTTALAMVLRYNGIQSIIIGCFTK